MSKYTPSTRRIFFSHLMEMLELSDGCCWYCGKDIGPGEAVLDHIVPQRHGGPTSSDNLVPVCVNCNNAKCARPLGGFRRILQRRRDGRPSFTEEQTIWLAAHGFEMPGEPFVFWFEELGLELPGSQAAA
jgi:5-methylcytosine-specific restriction endonuclease McrA